MRLGRKLEGVVLILFMIGVFGCATPMQRIRTTDSMLKENPVEKITVLAEGTVIWGFSGSGKPALGLTESKNAVAQLLPNINNTFSKKGYTIVFSEPIGIGYRFYVPPAVVDKPRNKNENSTFQAISTNPSGPEPEIYPKCYENYGKEGDKTKTWEIRSMDPVYEYPIVSEMPELGKAARRIFENINSAMTEREVSVWTGKVKKKSIDTFTPQKDDLKLIQETTGADTVCFVRISGTRYTETKKAVGAVLAAFMNLYSAGTNRYRAVEDSLETYFICTGSESGEVLWQHASLQLFPDIDRPVDSKCKRSAPNSFEDPNAIIYACPIEEEKKATSGEKDN